MKDYLLNNKKNHYRKYISYIFGIAVFALLIVYLFENQEILSSLQNISWQSILWIVLLDMITFLIIGFFDQSMINRIDPNVSFLDCYLLGYANNFLNKLLPTIGGGATFRAIYLKTKYQLSYSQFVSTVAGLYVISFFSQSLSGLICLLIIYSRAKEFNWLIFLSFFGIFIFCLTTMVFSPKIPAKQNKMFGFLKSIFDGWNLIKTDPKFILIYALLSIVLLLLSTFQILFSFQSIGIKTNIVQMIFLSTLGIILAFINFTPDGVGIKEGVYVFSSKLVQIPDQFLILGSIILRSISFFTTFIIGGVCYLILIRRLKAYT